MPSDSPALISSSRLLALVEVFDRIVDGPEGSPAQLGPPEEAQAAQVRRPGADPHQEALFAEQLVEPFGCELPEGGGEDADDARDAAVRQFGQVGGDRRSRPEASRNVYSPRRGWPSGPRRRSISSSPSPAFQCRAALLIRLRKLGASEVRLRLGPRRLRSTSS